MNWRSINFDWNRARAFLVTAEEGSYSKAAKALGMTQPTLGRQVSALEKELGVVLFERLGNHIRLTPSGSELLEQVRLMGDAARGLSLTATGQSNTIVGHICITATEVMAAYVLAPLLRKLRMRAPGLQVEVIASNQASDLRKREADIAIRNFEPTQSDLIAKRLEDGKAYLYAHPSYLQQQGSPKNKRALAECDFIGFNNNTPYIKALNDAGIPVTEASFPLITESHIVHWEMVKAAVAIGVMPNFIGDKDRDVVRVLPDMEAMTYETWLVVHRELKTNRRVRLVFDFLLEELGAMVDPI